MLVCCHLIATALRTTRSSYLVKIKLKNVEFGLSKFSVLCSLLENRVFCWMKYLVIIKILYVSYMHAQFSETSNLVSPVRTDVTFKYL